MADDKNTVELIIRGKTELKKAFSEVSKTIKSLKTSQADLDSSFDGTAAAVSKVNDELSKISDSKSSLVTTAKSIKKFKDSLDSLVKQEAGVANLKNSLKVLGDVARDASKTGFDPKIAAQLKELDVAAAKTKTSLSEAAYNLNKLKTEAQSSLAPTAKSVKNFKDATKTAKSLSKGYEVAKVALAKLIEAEKSTVIGKRDKAVADLEKKTTALKNQRAEVERVSVEYEKLASAGSGKASRKLQSLTTQTAKLKVLEKQQKDLTAAVVKTNAAVDASSSGGPSKAVVKQTAAVEKAEKAWSGAALKVKEYELELKKLSVPPKLAKDIAKQEASIADLTQTYNILRAEAVKANAALSKSTGPVDPVLAKQIKTLTSDLAKAESKMNESKQALSDLDAELKVAGVDTSKLSRESKKLIAAEKALVQAERARVAVLKQQNNQLKVNKGRQAKYLSDTRKALSVTQRLRGQILSLISAYVGLYGIANQVGTIFGKAGEVQASEARLTVAFDGDVDKVKAEMERLRKLSNYLKVDFLELSSSFSKFAATALPSGQASLSQARFMFEQISIAARVAGTSADDFKGIFKAIEQIFSKGTITAEDFKGQIGDRLAGAMVFLGKATGEAGTRVTELMKNGELGAENMISFAKEIGYEYGKALPLALISAKAEMSDFNNVVTEIQLEIGNSGFLDAIVEGLRAAAVELKKPEIREALIELSKGIGSLIANAPKIIPHLEKIVKVMGAVVAVGLGAYIFRIGQTFYNVGNFIVGAVSKLGKAKAVTGKLSKVMGKKGLLGVLLRVGLSLGKLALPGGLIWLAVDGFSVLYSIFNGDFKAKSVEDTATAFAKSIVQSAKEAGLSVEEFTLKIKDNIQARKDSIAEDKKAIKDNKRGGQTGRGRGVEAKRRIDQNKLVIAALNKELDNIEKASEEAEFELTQISIDKQVNRAQGIIRSFSTKALTSSIAKLNKEIGNIEADTLEEKLTIIKNTYEQKTEKLLKAQQDLEENLRGGRKENETQDDFKQREDSINITLLQSKRALGLLEQEFQALQSKLRATVKAGLVANVEDITREYRQAQIEAYDLTKDDDFEKALTASEKLVTEYYQRIIDKLKGAGLNDQVQAVIDRRQQVIKQAKSDLGQDREDAVEDNRAADEKEIEDAMKPVNALFDDRARNIENINVLRENGMLTSAQAAEALKAEFESTKGPIEAALTAAEGYIAAFTGPEAEAARKLIEDLRISLLKNERVVQKFIPTAEQMNDSLATGLGNAFTSFAEGAKSAKDAFKDFAANFLRQIAQMIIQQAILNAIGGGDGTGGVGGAITGFVSSLFHNGGVVGSTSRTRKVSPSIFAGAPMYHGGGIAGLKPNEVPSILERGEEVLTASDPRHVNNGGGAGPATQPPVNVKVLNMIDSSSVVQEGLDSSEGEKSIMNIIRANRQQIKSVLT